MSLISDPDFLIHSLRLSYLRNVEDPYGPRLISLNPSYSSNPYIIAANLADTERWPELAQPSSPQLSDDERNDRPSGFPGATGLKYSQTIVGPSKSGGLGLRVDARRRRGMKRRSHISSEDVPLTDSNNAAPSTGTLGDRAGESWVNVTEIQNADVTPRHSRPPEEGVPAPIANKSPPPPPAKEIYPQFIPRFKGAAEMEERRKMRMLARRQIPGNVGAPPPEPTIINPELSSSEEDGPLMSESDEDTFDVVGGRGSMDDVDEFDPDFATTRTLGINSDSASDILSLTSDTDADGASTSASSLAGNHSQNPAAPRQSPVSGHKSNNTIPQRVGNDTDASYFEVITKAKPDVTHARRPSVAGPRDLSHLTATTTTPMPSEDALTFPRLNVPSARPLPSALTSLLAASSSTSANPFTDLYSAISGRADPASAFSVTIFFPHATNPKGKGRPMELSVRRDATVEEVIGFALWNYWDSGWIPKLDDGVKDGEEDVKLSGLGWIMRIAEDDGEVDDEFPPPDRTGKISKFNFDAYAILEATPAQVQQNQILESKIQRRPSRTMAKRSDRQATLGVPASSMAGVANSGVFGSTLDNLPLSTSLGPSSSHGPQTFLRIRVADTANTVHISTTIPVSAGMYMQEALEFVCRKRKIPNPKDYALLLGDMSILIPLDRTVASLQGTRDLVLIKRSMLPQLGSDGIKGTGRTTDPNASIFKRISEVPELQYTSAVDVTAAYKKYTVYRKMPMLVTRQERTLAIDGGYVHIMPSSNKAKAVFDHGKTSSYHIKSIVNCQQSTKSSSIFKFVVQRGEGIKQYDYEAESPKLASEIVQTIKNTSKKSKQIM